MATIHFTQTPTGYIASIAGNSTTATNKIINQYAKKRNLAIIATVHPKTFGYEPSYLQTLQDK